MISSETSSEYKMSSYNSAGNLIKRLDSLWETAHRDVRGGNYLDWNTVLDRLWLEVSGDLQMDAKEHTMMDAINQEIIKLCPLTTGNTSGFNKKTKEFYERVSKQYLAIKKKERLIKFMEGKLGLGKAYVDEFEDDWD